MQRLKKLLSYIQQMPAHRGATAVEYALVVTLVVAGLAATLGDLSTTSANAVEGRGDRIGNPQSYTNVVDPGGETGGVVGTDLPDADEALVAVHLAAILNQESTWESPKWRASVDVQILAADSQPAMTTLEGEWIVVKENGNSRSISASCETDALGDCTMTIDGLGSSDAEASFIYVGIVVDSTLHTWNSDDDTADHGTPATVLICRPDRALNTAEDACE